jgi:hypothetical protein
LQSDLDLLRLRPTAQERQAILVHSYLAGYALISACRHRREQVVAADLLDSRQPLVIDKVRAVYHQEVRQKKKQLND